MSKDNIIIRPEKKDGLQKYRKPYKRSILECLPSGVL